MLSATKTAISILIREYRLQCACQILQSMDRTTNILIIGNHSLLHYFNLMVTLSTYITKSDPSHWFELAIIDPLPRFVIFEVSVMT